MVMRTGSVPARLSPPRSAKSTPESKPQVRIRMERPADVTGTWYSIRAYSAYAAGCPVDVFGLGMPRAFVVDAVTGGVIVAELLFGRERVLLDESAGAAQADAEGSAGFGVFRGDGSQLGVVAKCAVHGAG